MKRIVFALMLVLPIGMLSTYSYDGNVAKAATSDTSEINLAYIKKNLKPGLTKEQVKKKLGSSYEVFQESMNNREGWRYKIGKIKDYKFSEGLPDEVDIEGIKKSRLKLEVSIIFKENQDVADYISVHYLNNGEVLNYFIDSDGYIKDRSADPDKGDKLPIVKEYQKKLISIGYKLPRYFADGHFGSETEKAVKQFQRNNNLLVDGVIGPNTAKKLDEAKPSTNTNTYPGTLYKLKNPYMQGEQVRKIQKVVGVTQDGIYGPKTEKAVRSFQQKNGATTDGIIGPKTWAILF